MQIYRMVYLSDATDELTSKDLSDILEKARRNNARHGLTGVLLFHQSRFFQVLEGDKIRLTACFNRIRRDPRHTTISLMAKGPAEERAFPNWRMGYAKIEELPEQVRSAAFSLYDLVPANSEARGYDKQVRLLVRDFLASYQSLQRAS